MNIIITRISPLLLFGFMIYMLSCSDSTNQPGNNVVADPEGTITANVSMETNFIFWQGLADKPQGTFQYLTVGMAMSSILNTKFAITTCPDLNNCHGYNHYEPGVEASCVGTVTGLGDVKNKPTSGFSKTCAFEKGKGFVIRFKKSYDQSDPSLPYYYGRFYVEDWILDIYGGVAGAKIKYQGLF